MNRAYPEKQVAPLFCLLRCSSSVFGSSVVQYPSSYYCNAVPNEDAHVGFDDDDRFFYSLSVRSTRAGPVKKRETAMAERAHGQPAAAGCVGASCLVAASCLYRPYHSIFLPASYS